MALSIADRKYARFRDSDEYFSYRALLTGSPSGPGPQSSAPLSQFAAPPMRPVPSRGADADAFIEFLRTGVDRLYHGKWQDFSGGFGTAIEVDGLGIHVLHHEDNVGFAAGILSGVEFSEGLLCTVSKISCGSAMGALTLREGQPGHWSLTWGASVTERRA